MKYGFLVDKHAPWRIFADIASPAMKPYLEKYNVTEENFFDTYYDKLLYPDLDTLKIYIIQMYNAYVSSKPSFSEPVFSICNGRTKMRTKKTFREVTTKEILEIQISEETWIRFFTFIKAREQNLGWNQSYFEEIVQKTIDFKQGVDIQTAMRYLERKTKLPLISSKKERNFRF